MKDQTRKLQINGVKEATTDGVMPRPKPGIALLIEKAFLAAHLFTASVQQAEEAAMKGIDSWNPDDESEETLFQKVLTAASGMPADLSSQDASGGHLPNELLAVLRLAPGLRRCFVLRILAGFPSQACARMLRLHPDQVDQYTCAAVQSLSGRTFHRCRSLHGLGQLVSLGIVAGPFRIQV